MLKRGVLVASGIFIGAAGAWAAGEWQKQAARKADFNSCIGKREMIIDRLQDPVSKIDSHEGELFLGIKKGSFYELWQRCRATGFIRPSDEQAALIERAWRAKIASDEPDPELPLLPHPVGN